MTNKLRHIAHFILLGALFAGSSAFAQSVVGSKHDFTTGGGAQLTTGETDQVCVFCHTPHGADTAAPVPLWNKVLTPGTAYQRYSVLATPTFDSEEAPVGSVSLACLSCHDGTQAMDVVLNSPGSGGYDPAGAQIDAATFNPGTMTDTPVPNLGTDLRNDHPVSMQYAGGGVLATDPDGVFNGTLDDPDFENPVKATINGQAIWWVDSVAQNGTREKTDMLLYSRTDLSATAEPFVECGSCHDPHNSDNFTNQVSFLRTSNAASAVCTACHVK